MFRALAALPGDVCLIPSTYTAAHSHQKLQFQGTEYYMLMNETWLILVRVYVLTESDQTADSSSLV